MSLQAAFRHHEQSQEERIRGRCAWGWAWWLHPPRTVHNWEPRSRIHHFLQTSTYNIALFSELPLCKNKDAGKVVTYV
jgi:hypothetical protein